MRGNNIVHHSPRKKVHNIERFRNKLITKQPSRREREIIPCIECQEYGHCETYCNRAYAHVKCKGPYNNINCKKSGDTFARCALFEGATPPTTEVANSTTVYCNQTMRITGLKSNNVETQQHLCLHNTFTRKSCYTYINSSRRERLIPK